MKRLTGKIVVEGENYDEYKFFLLEMAESIGPRENLKAHVDGVQG
ncbi:MAG: hypothetical protein QXS51_05700 [Thermoproteota archaeon]